MKDDGLCNIRSGLLLLATWSVLLLAGCAGSSATKPLPVASLPPEKSDVKPMFLTPDEEAAALQKALEKYKDVKFTLGRGDTLSVSVYGEPDLVSDGVPIRPDGMVSLPLVGDVQAMGKTVGEVVEAYTEGLKAYIRSPKVTIVVKDFKSLSYIINGEVKNPGVYPLDSDVTLNMALAKAGGLSKGGFQGTTTELADLSHAYLARKGEVLPINFSRLIRDGDLRFDVQLMPGDLINIPSGLSKEVYILGEVQGAYQLAFRENLPLSVALTKAHGFTKDADLSRVHVVRGSLSNPVLIVVDMDKVLNGEARDMQLEAGDLVYVPPTYLTSWSRMLSKIVPTMSALTGGVRFIRGR